MGTPIRRVERKRLAQTCAALAACVLVTLMLAACAQTSPAADRGLVAPPGPEEANRRFREAVALAIAAQNAEADAMKAAENGKAERAAELYNSAIEGYYRAVRTWRDLPAAWLNLGVLLLNEGRYLEAQDALLLAGELTPSDPRPQYNLGLLWERAGYEPDARRHYESALVRDDRYLPALRGLILLDHRLRRSDETTMERIRTAMLLETDPAWRELYQRELSLWRAAPTRAMGAGSP